MSCAITLSLHIGRISASNKRRFIPRESISMTKRAIKSGMTLLGAALLSACVGVREHRGFVLDDQLAQSVQAGVDNKESVTKTLGRPTFVGQFDANDWYYLSQDTHQFAFRDPRVVDQKLLHIRFDPAGNVVKVATTGKELIAAVDPVGDYTPTLGRQRSFFDELFGNIGSIAQPGLPGANPSK
jgi:outer membrane protein assembly factor BamE (lipoprotein component of BamABCDE complex)